MYSHVPQNSLVVLTHAPHDQQFLSELGEAAAAADSSLCVQIRTARWLQLRAPKGNELRAFVTSRKHREPALM